MKPKLDILIVDDDQRMTRTLMDILTLAGHNVVEAHSGPRALEKVQAQMFDCVLTDVRMPGMDGVELHRHLRAAQPGLPVILMTAFAADSLTRQGLEEGVVGVLDKPLDVSHLLSFLTSLGRNRTITIVDDDPVFCHTLEDVLCKRGFVVTKITDPHAELDAITAEAEVILLDMKLNGINGLNVLKNIRAQHPDLPVLLVTGYRDEMASAIQGALEIDAFACLYKPLEIPQLLQLLGEFQTNHLRKLLKST
ncbi:MAG: response regulator [Chloroflexi bacterium]|nr:response regulator [Chloroflexota bacterium]